MAMTDLERALEGLMGDPRLVELCELQRTGDEVLDVISLSENQHSDILAWMLDAKEGHGQGDEILRDLLISASVVVSGVDSGLDGRGAKVVLYTRGAGLWDSCRDVDGASCKFQWAAPRVG